jgi:hypothetical protein
MSAADTPVAPASTPPPANTTGTSATTSSAAPVVRVSSGPPIPAWVDRAELAAAVAAKEEREVAELAEARAANTPKSWEDYKDVPMPPGVSPMTAEQSAMSRQLAFGQRWTNGVYSRLSMAVAGALYHAAKGVPLEQYQHRNEDDLVRRFGDDFVGVVDGARRQRDAIFAADPQWREILEKKPHVAVDSKVLAVLAEVDSQNGGK